VTVLDAGLDAVAAEDLGEGAGELVYALLPVHDEPALGPDVEAKTVEERKGLIGGVVIHVLGEAEGSGIELLERQPAVVGVDKPVVESPDGRRILHERQVARGRWVWV
jgi:hypothetical protein